MVAGVCKRHGFTRAATDCFSVPLSPRLDSKLLSPALTPVPSTEQIDVMVLYSVASLVTMGVITPAQMETIILEGLVGTNEAFVNSEVSVYFNPVHIGQVRCACFSKEKVVLDGGPSQLFFNEIPGLGTIPLPYLPKCGAQMPPQRHCSIVLSLQNKKIYQVRIHMFRSTLPRVEQPCHVTIGTKNRWFGEGEGGGRGGGWVS